MLRGSISRGIPIAWPVLYSKQKSRLRKFEQVGKWSFCLKAGKIGETMSRRAPPAPRTGFQSQGGLIRTTSLLQRTCIAVEFGGTIAVRAAVVHGAGGVQHFVFWKNVDTAPFVLAKVAA